MSNKEQQVTDLVLEIKQLETTLAARRGELRTILGTAPATTKTGATRQKIPTVKNVSAEVLAYVTANPGTRARDVVQALGLAKREGTVRAALKKHQQAGRLINVGGLWGPVTQVPVQTQKAPEPSPTQGLNQAPEWAADGGYMGSRMASD